MLTTKSMTENYVDTLPTLGMNYQAIRDPELTLPEGLLPDLPEPIRGIDTSLPGKRKNSKLVVILIL